MEQMEQDSTDFEEQEEIKELEEIHEDEDIDEDEQIDAEEGIDEEEEIDEQEDEEDEEETFLATSKDPSPTTLSEACNLPLKRKHSTSFQIYSDTKTPSSPLTTTSTTPPSNDSSEGSGSTTPQPSTTKKPRCPSSCSGTDTASERIYRRQKACCTSAKQAVRGADGLVSMVRLEDLEWPERCERSTLASHGDEAWRKLGKMKNRVVTPPRALPEWRMTEEQRMRRWAGTLVGTLKPLRPHWFGERAPMEIESDSDEAKKERSEEEEEDHEHSGDEDDEEVGEEEGENEDDANGGEVDDEEGEEESLEDVDMFADDYDAENDPGHEADDEAEG